jgi:hypothetical protein
VHIELILSVSIEFDETVVIRLPEIFREILTRWYEKKQEDY